MSYNRKLVEKVKAVCNFPDAGETQRIVSGLRWIGLFSSDKAAMRAGNLLDTLCARLEALMKYEAGERDLVMLQHKFFVEWADGTESILTSTLEAYGAPQGHSAMALTVGLYAWPQHAHAVAVAAVIALTVVNYLGVQKSAWLTRVIVAVVLAAKAKRGQSG